MKVADQAKVFRLRLLDKRLINPDSQQQLLMQNGYPERRTFSTVTDYGNPAVSD